MVGFPIVIMGATTSISGSDPNFISHNASIVIPQFEVDEYFNKNETLAYNKYKGGYYPSEYVNSVEIKSNNLNKIMGTQSIINASFGFSFDESKTWNNSIYSIESKIENLQSHRIDSFYCSNFQKIFL